MKIKKWCVYRADLDPVVGSEQGRTRPVIVISENEINDLLNIVNVLPVTSRKPARNIYPNEVLLEAKKFGLHKTTFHLTKYVFTTIKILNSRIGDFYYLC